MTEAELKEIEKHADAATSGPWLGQSKDDAKFISTARIDMRKLVAEVRRSRAEALRYREALEQIKTNETAKILGAVGGMSALKIAERALGEEG